MRLCNLLLSALFFFVSCQLTYATSYTWNGSSSSDWGTAANWTPNGVPGANDNVTIVSAGTAPVYDGVAGVTAFNMYSGSLDLNGYTLNISGQGYFSGGTVSNGVINATGTITYFFGGTLDAKVIVNSAKPYLNGATFNDSLIFEVTGNGAQSNGGNVFNGPVIMTNSGNYSPYYGHLNPDTFNDNLHIYNTGAGAITLANSSDDHYFADTIFINCTSGQGINFGNAGVEYSIASGKPIVVGESGFSVGTLKLRDFVQLGTCPFNLTLTGTASMWLSNCTFGGDLMLTTPYIDFYDSAFNGKFNLTRSGASNNNIGGGNIFNDTVTITNTGNNMIMAINDPDTFNYLVTFRNEGAGYLTIGYNTPDNYFNGDVKLYNLTASSSLGFQPFGSGGSTVFNGNVLVNCKSSGGLHFAPSNMPELTMTAGHTIAVGDTGFIAGALTLRLFEQLGDSAINLVLTGTSDLDLVDSEFGGDFIFNGPAFTLDGVEFNGLVDFTRNASSSEVCIGSNTFNEDASFTNDGTGTLTFAGSDTYYGNVSYTATSTGYIKPGNAGTHNYKGDITTNDPDLVTLGIDYAGSKVVLSGNGLQTISSEYGGTIQFRDLKVDKDDSYVRVLRDISILDSLQFDDGVLKTYNSKVIFKDNAKADGASDTSHVEGKVQKIGNDAFVYPVGRNGQYRSINISAPSSTSDAYTAEYFDENSDPLYSHTEREDTLDYINTAEYWYMSRDVGTSNVTVTISWEDIDCGIDDLDTLLVAGWDTASDKWVSWGNGTATGNTTTGTLSSDSAVTDFGAFALGNYLNVVADAGPDRVLKEGDTTSIGMPNDTNMTYSWTPSDSLSSTTVSNPMAWPDTTTTYYLTVTGENTCDTIDSVTVHVVPVLPDTIPPRDNYAFIENKGQLIDTDGNLRPDIGFYNTGGGPAIYLRESGWSHVWSDIDTSASTLDTLYRVDIDFLNTDTTIKGIPMTEMDSTYTNFFYGHCPRGIVNVPSYRRIVYPEIYENIDLHFYSNRTWYKIYFVVKPGGDPTDIEMRYSGTAALETGCVDSLAYPTPWDTVI